MSESKSSSSTDSTPIKFHFFEINFTPYKDIANKQSANILVDVVTFLGQERQKGNGILVDKHEARKNEIRRPLFITNIYFMFKERRVVGSIALLRAGKIPKLKPAETYTLIPLDTSKGEIAEETHFFIDYSTPKVVMCVEYNHEGPRASDIEFYLRIVARDKLRLAKATEVNMFMDTSIDKTLSELKNVLQFEMKIQPQKLSQLDSDVRNQYLSGMSNLNNIYNPKYLKVEALFQTPGKQYASSELNVPGNAMAKKLLNLFKTKPVNADLFDNFVIKYQTEDGREEFFNLIKGKKEILKFVNLRTIKGRMWYELIETDLSDFIETFR